MEIIDVMKIVKVFAPMATAFVIGIIIAPLLTHYLYKFRVWKKTPGKQGLDGQEAIEFNRIHKKRESNTPRMGGILIWSSVLLTTAALWIGSKFVPFLNEIEFLSRSQTWIPFAVLMIGSLIGLINDIYDIKHEGRGIRLRTRLLFATILATIISWWFYSKLGVEHIGLLYDGELFVGMWIIPLFVLMTLGIYASGVIDGIDGLSGGVFATIFMAYAGVALSQAQFDLAAFCATVAGAILAFLWFNIPPARFWMTETGTMGITLTLSVVVLMSDNLGEGHGISLFPIIGLLLVVTVLSNVVQILSKKIRGKKVFIVAPLHHHFEALGWPGYKVTMRYWVISVVCATIGLSIAVTA